MGLMRMHRQASRRALLAAWRGMGAETINTRVSGMPWLNT